MGSPLFAPPSHSCTQWQCTRATPIPEVVQPAPLLPQFAHRGDTQTSSCMGTGSSVPPVACKGLCKLGATHKPTPPYLGFYAEAVHEWGHVEGEWGLPHLCTKQTSEGQTQRQHHPPSTLCIG